MIGSGIAGLSTAYELSERSRSVIVIDRGPIAAGMTARTSAHMAPLCDDLMSEMQKIKGKEQSKLFYESQAAAVDRIEEIKNKEGSTATSAISTAICFRATVCHPTRSMKNSMPCEPSARPSSVWSAFPSRDATNAMRCAISGKRPFTRSSIWRGWSRRASNARYNSLPTHRSRKSSRRTVQSPSRPRAALSAPLMLPLPRIRRLSIAWRCTPNRAVPDLRHKLYHRSRRAAGCALLGYRRANPGSEYVYVANGDSGQGLTQGVMGAVLNAPLVTGGESEWAELYAPDRKPLKAGKNRVMENSTALKNLTEYVTPGEIGSTDELKQGQGAILRDGLKKIAAYQDAEGAVHRHSAACTQLGCHLHWNSSEHCWTARVMA